MLLVTKARTRCQDHLYQSHAKLFAASALTWVTSRMHQVGLPRKQAGFIQISLPLNCCTDFGQINHFTILNLPFLIYKMGTIIEPPKVLWVLKVKVKRLLTCSRGNWPPLLLQCPISTVSPNHTSKRRSLALGRNLP